MEGQQVINFEALTPEDLSNLLTQLFQPNTDVVKQATAILKEYFKRIRALENLLILMSSHPE
jgi:hypothetical protein